MDLEAHKEISRLSPRLAALMVERLTDLCGLENAIPADVARMLVEQAGSRAKEQECRRAEERLIKALGKALRIEKLKFEVHSRERGSSAKQALVRNRRLTLLGRSVYKALLELVSAAPRMIEHLGIDESEIVTIRIAYRNALWEDLVKPVVTKLEAEYPRVQFHLLATAECPVRADSKRFDYKTIDLSLQYSAGSDALDPPFACSPLGYETFSLYCYAPNPASRVKRADQVTQYAMISRGELFRRALDDYEYPDAIRKPRFRFGVIQQALDYVLSRPGMAIHLSPGQLKRAKHWYPKRAKRLIRVQPPTEQEARDPIQRPIYLLENLDRSVSTQHGRLRDEIAKRMRDHGMAHKFG